MTIGIYCILHRESGKRYIGKSVNVEQRFYHHKHVLTRPVRNKEQSNRYLWGDVQKFGWAAFSTEIVETFDFVDEHQIAERELYWMDFHKSCDRKFGYNLRRDSSTRMIVHPETRALMAESVRGSRNPNFGNRWSPEQREAMRQNRLARAEKYDGTWRAKIGAGATRLWSDHAKRKSMAAAVSKAKRKYDFLQFDLHGDLLRVWSSIEEIVSENPEYKRQNIYSVCHGHKKTYRGFVWAQQLKAEPHLEALIAWAVAA